MNYDWTILNEEIEEIQKHCTKHEKLVELSAQKLMTAPKQYMDIVKICARNVYFRAFKDFKELFNNFRIDHVVFRTLIQSPGRIHTHNGKTIVSLHPAITLQPKEKELVGAFLKNISERISDRLDYHVDFELQGSNNFKK